MDCKAGTTRKFYSFEKNGLNSFRRFNLICYSCNKFAHTSWFRKNNRVTSLSKVEPKNVPRIVKVWYIDISYSRHMIGEVGFILLIHEEWKIKIC
jgi:hypothetical protein